MSKDISKENSVNIRKFRKFLLLACMAFYLWGMGTTSSCFMDVDERIWRFFVVIDEEAPTLTVITPAGRTEDDPTYAVSSSYRVTGSVSDDRKVTRVTVNGKDATLQDSGSWWCVLPLEDGVTQQIQVEAVDLGGNRVEEIRYVRYDSSLYFEDFVVTLRNRHKIGYTPGMTKLEIPETFYDEETGTWYYVVAIGYRQGDPTNTTYAAFARDTALTHVTIPGSVKSIERYSFYNATGLTELSLGYGIEMIGMAAFQKCDGLVQVSLPDSITELGSAVFTESKQLKAINLPKGLTEVYPHLFNCCYRLAGQMVIPEGVKVIGEGVFMATEITSVVIPASVTRVGLDAFRACEKLTDVYYEGTPEQWAQISFGRYNEAVQNAQIHYQYQGGA